MNFLVVDDNRLLNRFLTTYLRSKGHGCSSLTDSSKVVGWLDINGCDAIILDIGMPKIDGISLIGMIVAAGLGTVEQQARNGARPQAQQLLAIGVDPGFFVLGQWHSQLHFF